MFRGHVQKNVRHRQTMQSCGELQACNVLCLGSHQCWYVAVLNHHRCTVCLLMRGYRQTFLYVTLHYACLGGDSNANQYCLVMLRPLPNITMALGFHEIWKLQPNASMHCRNVCLRVSGYSSCAPYVPTAPPTHTLIHALTGTHARLRHSLTQS